MERDYGKRIASMFIVILWLALMIITLCNFMLAAQAEVEFDLNNMSLEELTNLQNWITLAMWNTDEWQEVRVPAGTYKIGESIPAGTWTIKPIEGGSVYVRYGIGVNESGAKVKSLLANEIIHSPTYKYYTSDDRTELTLNLVEDRYIEFDYTVIFTTPIPVTFNFKK